MRNWIGITDEGWFAFLYRERRIDEVDFGQPGWRILFRALNPGEPFLFRNSPAFETETETGSGEGLERLALNGQIW
jgi:hypothetical protein